MSLKDYRKHTRQRPEFLVGKSAPEIPHDLLASCKVVPRRNDIIGSLPRGGLGVEVGTQTGMFARTILDLAKPRKLFVIDLDYGPFLRENFANELLSEKIILKEGKSWEVLEEFPDETFDFIYVDAAHNYDMVKKDLDVSIKKIKSNGTIICNDFVTWSAMKAAPYGVHQAVTETIVNYRCEVTHFAFHHYGYNDIAFKRGE